MFRFFSLQKCLLFDFRENLERKEVQLKNKGLITGASAQQEIAANSAVLGAGRIAQLEAELRQAKVCVVNYWSKIYFVQQWGQCQ